MKGQVMKGDEGTRGDEGTGDEAGNQDRLEGLEKERMPRHYRIASSRFDWRS